MTANRVAPRASAADRQAEARNPSARRHRLVVALVAVFGAGVSAYLALFELGVLGSVWDPVFGASASEAVLHSSFSKALPVPDALLGALNYVADVALDLAGGDRRWRTNPRLVLIFAVPVVVGVMVSVFLVALQAFVIGHFCVLCLVSAGVSFVIGALAAHEILAAYRVWRRPGRLT